VRSSAKAITYVGLEKSKFKRALYMMFQKPGPQHEPWGQPFVTVLFTVYICVRMEGCYLVAKVVLRQDVQIFWAMKLLSMRDHHAASNAPLTSKQENLTTKNCVCVYIYI